MWYSTGQPPPIEVFGPAILDCLNRRDLAAAVREYLRGNTWILPHQYYIEAERVAWIEQTKISESKPALEHNMETDLLCYEYRENPSDELRKIIDNRRGQWQALFGRYKELMGGHIRTLAAKEFVKRYGRLFYKSIDV